jgi:TonB family protein
MRKLTIPSRYPLALTFILILTGVAFSQIENYSIPAKWELYSVADKKVSVQMPRLPVLIEQMNLCRSEGSVDYAAYNDGVVYILKIVSKMDTSVYCRQKKKFDEENFLERAQYLKGILKEATEGGNTASNQEVIKLTGNNRVTKLFNDYANKRWFELSVLGADESRESVKNFLNSLKFDDASAGIEIGNGADRVYGDDTAIFEELPAGNAAANGGKNVSAKRMVVKIDDKSEAALTIALKQRAMYTEAARQKQVQGKVVLRVTFQANGAIGEITPISELSHGLTEAAIAAARKIVFIPAQKDGVRYSVTKPVEYTFTIY